MFPNNIAAALFKFKEEPSYEVEKQEEKKNVKVEF